MQIKSKFSESDLISYHALMAKRSLKFCAIFNLILIPVFLISLALDNWKMDMIKTYLLVFILIYTLFIFLILNLSKKSMLKTNKIASDTTFNVFTFNEQEKSFCTETTKDDKIISTSTLSFDQVFKIVETSGYFYIFFNAMQFYVINKDGHDKAVLDKLTNIFKNNCAKYKFTK